ncbi:hypothetical protein RB628_11160 [Streptomyces sp. ADMS]|uniref:hypothetical protein n=1 Tax=Streptomyces sp. ADMS TaxID=3071415 RepID=UPI00296F0AC3|nr:hypothetical protein [Streptomyces sp. ADMS]MDW4905875.1 hypothetical protein [Streptomyces sp. ADMS]
MSELPAGGQEPEQLAPVLRLRPGGAAASDTAPPGRSPSTDAAPAPAPAQSTPAGTAADARTAGNPSAAQDGGSSTGLCAGSVIAVPLVGGGGVWR